MKPRAVVFYGGIEEHAVTSRKSGQWLCQYIPKSAYDVTPVEVTHEGNWKVPLGSLPRTGDTARAMEMLSQAVQPLPPNEALQRLLHKNVDSIITVLRGKGGDDGAMHSFADTLNIPIAGSSTHASALAYNKHHFAHAISDIAPTPYSETIPTNIPIEEIAALLRRSFTLPFFIKPVRGAGSHGIMHVRFPDDIPTAAQTIYASTQPMLAQEQSHGMELSITLFQDEQKKIHTLPASLITPRGSSFFDYNSKLRSNSSKFHHNDAFNTSIIAQAQAIAHEVYENLGCSGIVTMDMITDDGAIDVLELNTIPTFTESTPIIHQLRHAGMHPEQFITNGFL